MPTLDPTIEKRGKNAIPESLFYKMTTVYPRSFDQFYLVSYQQWIKTAWTQSTSSLYLVYKMLTKIMYLYRISFKCLKTDDGYTDIVNYI